ncbi:MAG: 2-keto-4-pentenoate hydratase, partial [Solirubrobacteraceae bacterium]
MSAPSETAAPQVRQQLADALLRARDSQTPIEPLTAAHPELAVADAYAIAGLGVEADLARGARTVGHKIGLTSLAVQQQLGVEEPDYGSLLSTMEIAPGATIERRRYIAPRVELELAFRLSAPLSGTGLTAADVRAATASVHPAIELVDSRIAGWRIALPDTVADRASSAGFVIGATGFALDELDVCEVEVALHRDGELVE